MFLSFVFLFSIEQVTNVTHFLDINLFTYYSFYHADTLDQLKKAHQELENSEKTKVKK